LFVNGEQVGAVDMDSTVPFIFSAEGRSVGSDYGDSVGHGNYRTTFDFTGTIKQVAFDLSGEATCRRARTTSTNSSASTSGVRSGFGWRADA
jgi:hypothetical protein